MQVQISRWGNSLGLRLPRALAEHIRAREGAKVNIVADGDRLVVEPVKTSYQLDDLLRNVTPEAMREAFDWGDDAGRERLDD
jgi:antitoxin MazE